MLIGAALLPFVACGPDHKPDQPCDGPSFNLVLRAEEGPLPEGTKINVRYGGNQDGESYTLGHPRTPQAVFCDELAGSGGASATGDSDRTQAGASGQGTTQEPSESTAHATVEELRCRLYTQGPARLDVTAAGYAPIKDEALTLDGSRRCNVLETFVLEREKPDAGS